MKTLQKLNRRYGKGSKLELEELKQEHKKELLEIKERHKEKRESAKKNQKYLSDYWKGLDKHKSSSSKSLSPVELYLKYLEIAKRK